MTNVSRRYYEQELGAGMAPSPGMEEMFGYTEPLRRFIQREGFEPQANEIPNTMPSWMPGKDYYTDFHKGDPYIKVDQGFARLPGSGYAALHPELKDVNPEDYPDIHKMAILADVAPYSREYNQGFSSCLTTRTSRRRGTRLPDSTCWSCCAGFCSCCRLCIVPDICTLKACCFLLSPSCFTTQRTRVCEARTGRMFIFRSGSCRAGSLRFTVGRRGRSSLRCLHSSCCLVRDEPAGLLSSARRSAALVTFVWPASGIRPF